MTSSPTKLRAELEEAKQHLRAAIGASEPRPTAPKEVPASESGRPALSKLNTLLGTTTVPDRPLALYQQVGVAQRPTYDLIANRVLGPGVESPTSFLDVEDNYASHVAHRLTELRQRLEAHPMPTTPPWVLLTLELKTTAPRCGVRSWTNSVGESLQH